MNHLKTAQGLIFIKDEGGEMVIAANKIICVSPYGSDDSKGVISDITGKSWVLCTPYKSLLKAYLMALKGQDSHEEGF